MKRPFDWRVGVLVLGSVVVGACGTKKPTTALQPTPPDVEAAPEIMVDSLELLLADVERAQDAQSASGDEVKAEVSEMFGGAEADEIEASGPSWDIPITMNDDVRRWLQYFQGDGRENFAIYLSRAGTYEPMMRAMFRDAGLPEDLVYVSLIESGFSPRAYSRARAVGLWQFIASTGRLYDLDVSYWVDERRDPILATKAAAAHLKDLHDEFGSWYLAVAAYNGGANRIRRGIRYTGSDDFWTLSDRRYLRRETRNYVPKLIAAALIAKQPEHFGFVDIQRSAPLAYDLVEVPDATSLDVVAEAAGVTTEDITVLNPQILRGVTPPSQRYSLRVPPGTGHRFATRFAAVPPSERVRWVQHVVRRGDTLGEIARAYGVSVSAITAANRGVSPRRLRIGQRLMIPRAGRVPQLATVRRVQRTAAVSRPTSPQRPDGPYITYRVQGGDSLWAIARRYDVTPRDLMRWNGLRSSRIYPGDEVRVYIGAK